MAGGVGTRFWPMSRTKNPKQFHDVLGSGATLIQQTYNRFADFIPAENIYIVTNQRYATLIKAQLPTIQDNQILLEPLGRNTAPCVAYACYKIQSINPDAVFMVAASDHLIKDSKRFVANMELSLSSCAQNDIIMTLGITPTSPNTGYGYIQYLDDKDDNGYFKVKTFVEKPTLEVAKQFLLSGDYVWNSGIFIFSARTIIRAFEKYMPEMAELFSEIKSSYYTENERSEINRIYPLCPNTSIDYGIMEKSEDVFVIPTSFGWSDLGTWGSVYENSEKDYYENTVKGGAIMYHSNHNMVHISNPNKIVVMHDMEGYIVVDTEDALLICKKEDEQKIREFVADVKRLKGEDFV